jgi:hypothetical protein
MTASMTDGARAARFLDGSVEAGVEGVDVGSFEAKLLHARFLARDQFDGGGLDPEEIGEQLAHGGVGAVVDRWRGDAELHCVAMAPDDGGASRARLHVDAEHDRIALDGVGVGPTRHFGPQGLGGCP